MSHFTTLKTRFVEKKFLKQALSEVSSQFGLGEIRENAEVSGFGGNKTRAEIVVSTRNSGFDLGFRKSGDSFELVADWWGIRDFNQQNITHALQQKYSYHAVREQLDEQGFALVEEKVGTDKTVRLLLRRAI
ncbi:DUF1257 domain-containing protein [Candidatus Sumerlaeota bacterium]|nr:DUF1257 domain-containing protein [Candidatus Sumerlaeota bacterium]